MTIVQNIARPTRHKGWWDRGEISQGEDSSEQGDDKMQVGD